MGFGPLTHSDWDGGGVVAGQRMTLLLAGKQTFYCGCLKI